MTLSRESVLALQRHFLGALSAPARTWLEPSPAKQLVLTGTTLRSGPAGRRLDLGTVDSPGRERHFVRVAHRGGEDVLVQLHDPASWLRARWLGLDGDVVSLGAREAGAMLELSATHDTDGELSAVVRLVVIGVHGQHAEELPVRMTARRLHASAKLDFNGSPAPRPFDFGSSDRPYELAVANETSVPLIVRVFDLPAWLSFEVDGHQRCGPLPGCFFERAAPFHASIRPLFFGRHRGSLRVETNDPRPGLQRIDLQFAACIEARAPFVRAASPARLRLRADQKLTVAVPLENWGRFPARLTLRSGHRSLIVPSLPVVPAVHEGAAGTGNLSITVSAAQLAPGTHTLPLQLHVDGGTPPLLELPVEVEVLPAGRPRSSLRPEMIGALFALLFLTLLFIFVVRGLP